MKQTLFYILAIALSTSCSAAYWSSSGFSGDDMYDTHSSNRTIVAQKSTPQSSTQQSSYTPYQRPESYYQYQYVSPDSIGTQSQESVSINPKYVSSTFDVWEQEEIAQSYQTYVYVNPTPAYWGWGVWGAYDPYYYGWGWNWGYPHYYGWGYTPARPMRPMPSRPNSVQSRPNIVQRPSSTTAPSTRSTSTVTRTPTKSTTTTTRPTTTTRSSSTTTRSRTSTTSSSSNTTSR